MLTGVVSAAAGYSGAEFDVDKTDIYQGGKMAENGMGLIFDEQKTGGTGTGYRSYKLI